MSIRDTPSKLLETWSWYGEAIKWFVAIAAAVMAFGFDQAGDRNLTGWIFATYLGASAFLALAAVSGLFSYLQLLGFANLREQAEPSKEQEARAKVHLKRMARGYIVMNAMLVAGLVTSAVWWTSASLPKESSPTEAKLKLMSTKPGEPPYLIRQGEVMEVLMERSDGSLVWQELQVPAAAPEP